MAIILVVDDNAPMRQLIRKILSKEGHDIFEAADGTVVSDILRKRVPHLVITDIFMPHRNGIEVIGDIRRIAPNTKIIAMTNSNVIREDLYFGAVRAFGVDATITKPFRTDALCEMVRQLLADQRVEEQNDR